MTTDAREMIARPITMQDVRLAVGEGKLSATDVLAGANAELARRMSLIAGFSIVPTEPTDVPAGCLNVGHQVRKPAGYPFPGEVRAVFKTRAGLVRYVIEATGPDYAGMLHIFAPGQIETAALRNLGSDHGQDE